MDELEQAEAYARKLSTAKDAQDYPYIGAGGRGIIQVFMQQVRSLERRIAALEARATRSDPE